MLAARDEVLGRTSFHPSPALANESLAGFGCSASLVGRLVRLRQVKAFDTGGKASDLHKCLPGYALSMQKAPGKVSSYG